MLIQNRAWSTSPHVRLKNGLEQGLIVAFSSIANWIRAGSVPPGLGSASQGKARASPTFSLLTTRISGTLNRLPNSYLQSVCGQSDSDSKLLLVYGGCWSSEARGEEQSWSMQ